MDRISSGIQENQFQLKPDSYEVKSSGCNFQMFSCENVDGSNFNCGIQVN